MTRIIVSVDEGRTVRDLFYNGFLDLLIEKGFEISIFTEAVTVPPFIQSWKKPGVEFHRLLPTSFTKARNYAFRARRKLMQWNIPRPLLEGYLALEQHFLYPAREEYIQQLKDNKPALLVTTNALSIREVDLVNSAHTLGIPTVGLVRSWDNVHKGLQSRPQHLAVWNEVNRQEVISLDRYQPQNVTIVGPCQFDPYFSPDTIWSREKFAALFDLDPNRPIILFATLGYFIPGLDETCWMDVLLDKIAQGAIPGHLR